MHKYTVLAFIAGWLLSLVFAPQALLGMFRGATNSA